MITITANPKGRGRNLRLFALFSAMFVCLSCASGNNASSSSHSSEPQLNSDGGASTAELKHMQYDIRGMKDDHYIWYSDDFFKDPSTEYNPHLASLSVYAAKYSMNPGNPESTDDTDWYETQSNRVKTFYELLGFNAFSCNDDYKKRTDFDTIGIACAYKYVQGVPLIACTVRSGGYFKEWENNVFLGDGSKSDMMHEGWYNAANKVLDFIDNYVKAWQIPDQSMKLWMAGYSRGAATINLAAGILDNRFDDKGEYKFGGEHGITLRHDDLYAYTFETPQGANILSKNVKHPKDPLYDNIFNIINPNDLVTKVGMGYNWGFTRFGIDKFISTKLIDAAGFDDSRKTTRSLYGMKKDWTCDDLTIYTIPTTKILIDLTNFVNFAIDLVTTFVDTGTSAFPGFFEEDNTKKNYDANIVSTIVLDECAKTIGSRSMYVGTLQNVLRTVMRAAVNDVGGWDEAKTIISIVMKVSLGSICYGIFGDLARLFDLFDGSVLNYDELLPVLGILAEVYAAYPNECMSLIGCISDIFANHSTDISVAFVKAQDSLYVDAYNGDHGDDPIKLCPLRRSASFRRVLLHDFNDIGLYNREEDNKRCISIDGHYFGASDITECLPGYAAGYYSRGTMEELEFFFPAWDRYRLHFTDYSKKPYDTVWGKATYYRFHNEIVDAGKYYTDTWTIYDDWCCFGVSTQTHDFISEEDRP